MARKKMSREEVLQTILMNQGSLAPEESEEIDDSAIEPTHRSSATHKKSRAESYSPSPAKTEDPEDLVPRKYYITQELSDALDRRFYKSYSLPKDQRLSRSGHVRAALEAYLKDELT